MRRRDLFAVTTAALLGPRGFAVARDVEYRIEGDFVTARRSGVEIGRVLSASPVALAAHANGRFLYVVNAVGEYEFLPRGTVETYDTALRLLATTPLSLSGTYPSDITLSPDGRYAVVAIAGGRAYNVLAVGAGGILGAPVQVVKRYGLEPDRVAFDVTGRKLYGGAGESFGFVNGRIEV
jgi:DNA-binding beta-propeller fold protein YncE